MQGDRARAASITFNDLIAFVCDIHPIQAIGTPPWAGSEKFDIELTAEGEGSPSGKQWKAMLHKFIADSFKLAFHRETKELPVYALSVDATGPKLTKSGGDPYGPPALEFGAQGTLHVTNSSMASFTQAMQAVVLDKPVVDQTGLEGRFNLTSTGLLMTRSSRVLKPKSFPRQTALTHRRLWTEPSMSSSDSSWMLSWRLCRFSSLIMSRSLLS